MESVRTSQSRVLAVEESPIVDPIRRILRMECASLRVCSRIIRSAGARDLFRACKRRNAGLAFSTLSDVVFPRKYVRSNWLVILVCSVDRDRLRERERQARAAMSVQAEQAGAGGGPDARHHHHGHHNHAHSNLHASNSSLFRAPVRVSATFSNYPPFIGH